MNTAEQTRSTGRSSGAHPADPRRHAGAPDSERRTLGEMLAEIDPLIECVPLDGPPLVLVVAAWMLLVVMLAGPVACLFALVIVMILAGTILAAVAASILGAPYLLVRHLRRHRAHHASIGTPAAQVVAIGSPRAAA